MEDYSFKKRRLKENQKAKENTIIDAAEITDIDIVNNFIPIKLKI